MHAIFGASEKCIAVHPSDMSIALVALDATVLVTGPKGDRRIPFQNFHRLPGDMPQKDNTLERGELIVAVEIPDNQFQKHVHYLKVRDRTSYAFALVSVAVAVDLQGDTIKDVRPGNGRCGT
jgi:xanthine dehydrogenase YagS FAD-binding subunit